MKRVFSILIILSIFILSGCFGKNKSPVANFQYLPTKPEVGAIVTFDASLSSDKEDQYNLLTRWDLSGDGNWDIDYSADKRVPDKVSYTYLQPGTYKVTLEVKDTGQATHHVEKNVTVVSKPFIFEGVVLDSRGGIGVGGAQVTLYNDKEEYTGQTESDGSFQLAVRTGLYQLEVTKEGRSTSKIQDLYLGLEIDPEMDIPLWEEFYPDWPQEAPIIHVNSLPQASLTTPLSGEIPLQIWGESELGIKSIEVTVGHQNYSPDYYFLSKNRCDITLDTTQLPDGWNYLRISMYDVNYNMTQSFIPLYIDNSTLNVKLDKPAILMLFSMTFGESLKLMNLDDNLSLQSYLPSGVELDLSKVMGVSSTEERTIFNQIVWTPLENAKGYRLYRSLSLDGNYRLIASTDNTSYTDLSSDLVPGQEVYYRVAAYSEDIDGPMSDIEYTIPLDVFNVSLLSPANQEIVTIDTPLLEWGYNQLVGDSQSYDILVQGITDESPSLVLTIDSQTSYFYDGTPLLNNKLYEWDIVSASAYREYSTVAFALSASGGQAEGALNGAFRFYTEF